MKTQMIKDNKTPETPNERNETREVKYRGIITLDDPNHKWLLGGVKQNRSIWFNTETEAKDWTWQSVETHRGLNIKVNGSIETK